MPSTATSAQIIVIGAPEARLDVARAYGTDHVISIDEHRSPQERLEVVNELTGGRSRFDFDFDLMLGERDTLDHVTDALHKMQLRGHQADHRARGRLMRDESPEDGPALQARGRLWLRPGRDHFRGR